LHHHPLKIRLSDTQRDVDSARSNGRDIKQQVEKWLQQTNAKVGDTDQFLESLPSTSSPTCWRFACDCNCKRRYKAAIAAETLSREIKTLLEECRFELGGVSFNPKPPPLAPTLAAASREKLLESLKDLSTTLVIGVYGKKGAGKTLVKRLPVAIESDGEFKGVVLTSAQRDATEIQQEIAERIGLSFTLRTRHERARWLHDRLVRIGKIVFIIDDVDRKIDLYEIGIPWPDDTNGCRQGKIVVVSSSSCVCEKMNLEVGNLSQQESLDLFDQLANGYTFASSNIQEARDHISAKQEWLPGEIEDIIGAIHNNDNKIAICSYGYIESKLSMEINRNTGECLLIHPHLEGKVREDWLWASTSYGAYLVYKMLPDAYGFNESRVEFIVSKSFKSCVLDPAKAASLHKQGLIEDSDMPKTREDEWLEIEMGSFYNDGLSNPEKPKQANYKNKMMMNELMI
ncbi:hypothetical protein V2J09_011235, partial [Rumex salicifolius]